MFGAEGPFEDTGSLGEAGLSDPVESSGELVLSDEVGSSVKGE